MTATHHLDRKLLRIFGITISILIVVGLLSYRNLRLSSQNEERVQHTHEVLASLESLLLSMASLEWSNRGFVLTSAPTYTAAFVASTADVRRLAANLRLLIADNPTQLSRLAELDKLITTRVEYMDTLAAIRQRDGLQTAAATVSTGRGERLRTQFHGLVGQMQEEELRLLERRDAAVLWHSTQTRMGLIFGAVLGLVIAAVAAWRVQRSSAKRGVTEQALRDSEDQYRTLLNEVQDYAIIMLDPQGSVVTWNSGAERIHGFTAEESIGSHFSRFFTSEDVRHGRPAEILRLTTAQGRLEEQGKRVRKDGSQLVASVTYTTLRDPEGTLRGFSEITRDVTESEESGAKYRGLLEAAPDAMVVVNTAGEIVLLNLQAEKQFGYRRDELLGQPVTNIIPDGFAERLRTDETRSAEDALAQQIGTGIELTARRKDGSEFPIEIMLSPLESAEGILVTAAIRNISVRRGADAHLAQMESRYRGLLEAAPDAMVVVNQASEIVLLNLQAEKQFGYRRDELLGQRVTNIIPEGFAERIIADRLRSAEEALAQQIGTGIELQGQRKDRSMFPLELMLSPLASPEGILVTAAIRDITKRKQAEAQLLKNVEELHRSNEELEQFAYIASHDLQEPLRMVSSYTALLARRYKGQLDSNADEFIAFAMDGATRMQRLIQDLLTFSRVGSKGKELANTSSEHALQRALQNLQGAIEERGALVTHDALPNVLADEMQLIQLFQNLLGNAIKYQRPGVPRVHVGASRDSSNKWLFSVQDNGLGIEPQYLDRIFGMFQRLHKREEFEGTGIGLAICKKIVERHGGHISVESQPGEGSTFKFPLAASEIA